MARVKLFLLEDLRITRYTLRRYNGNSKCQSRLGYHNAHSQPIADTPDGEDPPGCHGMNPPETPAKDDPRWPSKCEACDYNFLDEDERQVFPDALYRRVDTGETTTLDQAPAGALWDATWWGHNGPDGHCWMVRCPGGTDWMIDGKANNCNCPPPELDPNHHCWTRSGTAPELTANPSIATPNYHGWLRNGYLEEC